MNTFKAALLSISVCALVFAGCGENDPDAITGDYYPMGVGDYWEYIETYTDGHPDETIIHEVNGKETIDFGGELGERTVFVVDNTPDLTSTKSRTYYIEDDGNKVTRISQIVYDTDGNLTKTQDYVPGALKFDRTRVTKGETWDELIIRYTYDEVGTETGNLDYSYTFTITELHEKVTVPAGTFDCITITRERLPPLEYEIKTYYYASGVGKVKELSEGYSGNKMEELTSYSVGGLD
jgi:uncharacterized protein DUF3108